MHPNEGRVVSNFIIQAVQGQRIMIYGNGEQTRSFWYVDDLVEGFLRTMDTGPEFPRPVNLVNPNGLTIKELAEEVINLIGLKSQLVDKPLPQDDLRQRQPDVSLVHEMLGWEPKAQLRAGRNKTIGYFDELLRKSDADVPVLQAVC